MSAVSETPGLFGKLPSHGDFLTRRLSRNFLDKWDNWLQQAVASSKAELGDSWLNTYLTSPIWCFVIPNGVCGQRGWAGVMMPSVDRVGRYFPLTLAAPLPEGCSQLDVLASADEWFSKASQLALSALSEQWVSLEEFDKAVELLGPVPVVRSAGASAGSLSQSRAPGLCMPLGDSAGPLATLNSFLHPILSQRYPAYSVWWTEGSPQFPAALLMCNELPQAAAYAGLLNGAWREDLWLVIPGEWTPAAGARPGGPVLPDPTGRSSFIPDDEWPGDQQDGNWGATGSSEVQPTTGGNDQSGFLGSAADEPPDMSGSEGLSFEEFARRHSASSDSDDDLLIKDAMGGDVTSLGTEESQDDLPDPFADAEAAADTTQPRGEEGFGLSDDSAEPEQHEDSATPTEPADTTQPRNSGGFGSSETGSSPDDVARTTDAIEPGDTVQVPAIQDWSDPLAGARFGAEDNSDGPAEIEQEAAPDDREPVEGGSAEPVPEEESPLKDITVPRYREAARVPSRTKDDEDSA